MTTFGRSVLRFDRVTARTDDGAIHDASFRIGSGEAVAVVGPPQSGKSVLLFLAGGLVRPDVGQVTLNGSPLRPSDRVDGVAYWLPGSPSHDGRTAVEQIAMALVPKERSRRQALAAARRALVALDAGHWADEPIVRLDGTQLSILGVACVLARRPRFMLMNTGAPAGWVGGYDTLARALHIISTNGTGLLVASTEPMGIADRTIRISGGRLDPLTVLGP